MSKPPSLEQLKKLVPQLSPIDRINLLQFIANLPDGRITANFQIREVPEDPPILPSRKTQDILMLKTYEWGFEVNSESGEIIYFLDNYEVFRAKFNAYNYAEACFQKLKDNALVFSLSDEGRARLRQELQDFAQGQGRTAPVGEELEALEAEVLQLHSYKLLRMNLEELAQNIDAKLPEAVHMIFAKIVQAFGFKVANQLRDTLGMPEGKISAADVKSVVYKAEWEAIRAVVGLSPKGGARNIKHAWSDTDRECLARNYERLKPIWLDAKEIAKESQKSRVKNRKTAWRQEVLRAYPDLPEDLIEGFATPRGSKPSDNAIIHAARECGITPGISARHLRDVVTAWNLKHKPRTSTKKTKARKIKSPA